MEKSADKLYNGEDSSFGDTSSFAAIGKNASQVNKLNTAVFDKLKANMDKEKGKGSFQEFSDNAKRGFQKAVMNSYGNLPLGMQAAFLTSLGSSGLTGSDDFSFDDDFNEGMFQSEGVRLTTGGGMPGSAGIPRFDGGLESFGDEDFQQNKEERDPDNLASPSDALAGYKSSENDITAKSHTSIWKIISSRYMKSAVPALLEKK